MQELQLILSSVSYAVALGIGVACFRYFDLFYRLIFLQVCIAVIGYLASYWITAHQEVPNDLIVFNVYIVMECSILLYAGIIYTKNNTLKYWGVAGYVVFMAIFLAQRHKTKEFANYAACFEGIVLASVYLKALYQQFTETGLRQKSIADRLLFLGLVLYFGCSVPYLGMIKYLQKPAPQLNKILYYAIFCVLMVFRYFLTAAGFFLHRRQRLAPIAAQHE